MVKKKGFKQEAKRWSMSRGQEWSWVINGTEMWSHVPEGIWKVWLHKKVLGDSGE